MVHNTVAYSTVMCWKAMVLQVAVIVRMLHWVTLGCNDTTLSESKWTFHCGLALDMTNNHFKKTLNKTLHINTVWPSPYATSLILYSMYSKIMSAILT